MAQLILAKDLLRMGVIKFDLDNFVLNGISYSRGTSFSQRVQIAAEKMCQKYQEQGIKCLLVQDGIMLTLWLSQPSQVIPEELESPSTINQVQAQKVAVLSENTSNSLDENPPSLSVTKEQIMTYRGNIYNKIITHEKTSCEVKSNEKSEILKKRVYRGLEY